MKQHHDEITAKLPKDRQAGMLRLGGSFCDATHRADVAAFFGPRAAAALNGERTLAQTLESMDLCITCALRDRPAVARFLRKW